MEIIGYISAPTGAGHYFARHGHMAGFRGRKPIFHGGLGARRAAQRSCAAIEWAGRRDGGRGRDCYIVAVAKTDDGIEVTAGQPGTGTGYVMGSATTPLGCSCHVADAVAWLHTWSARRQQRVLGCMLAPPSL